MNRRRRNQRNWELPLAMIVGAVVTLACVLQSVSPPAILLRVSMAVGGVLFVGKAAQASTRVILTRQPR